MKTTISGQRSAVSGQPRLAALLFTMLACAGLALADGLSAFRETTKTNSDAATPVRVAATRGNYFRSATFYGKLHARTNNTGSVYLGVNSANNTQAIEVPAGGAVVISAPANTYLDLYDIYLDVVTANDGVVVIWTPAP